MGVTNHYRLNSGGDGQDNSAIRIVVIRKFRTDECAKEYVAKRWPRVKTITMSDSVDTVGMAAASTEGNSPSLPILHCHQVIVIWHLFFSL